MNTRQLPLLLALTLVPNLAHATSRACPKPSDKEEVLYGNDFKWGYDLPEMKSRFQEVYASGKRLKGRAYLDPASRAYVFETDAGKIRIDPALIASVTRHVEIALERRYADFVFFPDLGHSHFYIPEADWPAVSKHSDNRKDVYETMFALRSLKILYHTAEQLRIRDGEHNDGAFPQSDVLLWRYNTRNVVGDNRGGENVYVLFNWTDTPKYNSVGEMAGYHSWSAGFNISASKDGCFPFRQNGQTLYFDLSLEDLPYKDDGSGGGN